MITGIAIFTAILMFHVLNKNDTTKNEKESVAFHFEMFDFYLLQSNTLIKNITMNSKSILKTFTAILNSWSNVFKFDSARTFIFIIRFIYVW